MEPSAGSATDQRVTGNGRKGSPATPEVHENGPGHVTPLLQRDLADFDPGATRFLAGETPETEFIGFRLKQGVYGQRQADVQMIPAKPPVRGVPPDPLESLPSVTETY